MKPKRTYSKKGMSRMERRLREDRDTFVPVRQHLRDGEFQDPEGNQHLGITPETLPTIAGLLRSVDENHKPEHERVAESLATTSSELDSIKQSSHIAELLERHSSSDQVRDLRSRALQRIMEFIKSNEWIIPDLEDQGLKFGAVSRKHLDAALKSLGSSHQEAKKWENLYNSERDALKESNSRFGCLKTQHDLYVADKEKELQQIKIRDEESLAKLQDHRDQIEQLTSRAEEGENRAKYRSHCLLVTTQQVKDLRALIEEEQASSTVAAQQSEAREADLSTQLSNSVSDRNELLAKQKLAEGEISDLKRQARAAALAAAEVERELQEQLTEKDSELAAQQDTMEAGAQSLRTTRANLEGQIRALKTQRSRLESDLSREKTAWANLEATKVAQDKTAADEISTLKSGKAALEVELKIQMEAKSAAYVETSTKTQAYEMLKSQMADDNVKSSEELKRLRSEKASAVVSVEAHQTTIEQMCLYTTKLEDELKEQQKSYSKLAETQTSVDTELVALQKSYESLKSRNSKTEAELAVLKHKFESTLADKRNKSGSTIGLKRPFDETDLDHSGPRINNKRVKNTKSSSNLWCVQTAPSRGSDFSGEAGLLQHKGRTIWSLSNGSDHVRDVVLSHYQTSLERVLSTSHNNARIDFAGLHGSWQSLSGMVSMIQLIPEPRHPLYQIHGLTAAAPGSLSLDILAARMLIEFHLTDSNLELVSLNQLEAAMSGADDKDARQFAMCVLFRIISLKVETMVEKCLLSMVESLAVVRIIELLVAWLELSCVAFTTLRDLFASVNGHLHHSPLVKALNITLESTFQNPRSLSQSLINAIRLNSQEFVTRVAHDGRDFVRQNDGLIVITPTKDVIFAPPKSFRTERFKASSAQDITSRSPYYRVRFYACPLLGDWTTAWWSMEEWFNISIDLFS